MAAAKVGLVAKWGPQTSNRDHPGSHQQESGLFLNKHMDMAWVKSPIKCVGDNMTNYDNDDMFTKFD
jgi:hypothetical protein